MSYKVRLMIAGQKQLERQVGKQEDAANLLAMWMAKLGHSNPELETNPIHEGGGKERFIRVRYTKDGEDAGYIEATKMDARPDVLRPLTGKYKAFRLFLQKSLKAEALAKDVTAVIGSVLEGNHPMEEQMGPITVGDLLRIPGFYTQPELVKHLVEMYVGRFARTLAKHQFKIDMTDPDAMHKLIQAVEVTNTVERAAVPLVIAMATKKYGVPVVTEGAKEAGDALIDKISTVVSADLKEKNIVLS